MATTCPPQPLDGDMYAMMTSCMGVEGVCPPAAAASPGRRGAGGRRGKATPGSNKRGGRREALGELPSNDQKVEGGKDKDDVEEQHGLKALVVKERQMRYKIHKMELTEAARLEMQVQNLNIKKHSMRAREDAAGGGMPQATPSKREEFDRDVTSDGKPIYSFEQGTPGGMCVYFLKGFCCLGNKCRYVHDETDDGRFVKITGMPYEIGADAVINFFAPIQVPMANITFIEAKDGKPSGSAIVEFKDRKEALLAQHKDRAHITPARYVLLYPSSGMERDWHKRNAEKQRTQQRARAAAQAAAMSPSPHHHGMNAMNAMNTGMMGGVNMHGVMSPQHMYSSPVPASPFTGMPGNGLPPASPAAALLAVQQQQQQQQQGAMMSPALGHALMGGPAPPQPGLPMDPMMGMGMEHFAQHNQAAALAAELTVVNQALMAQLQQSQDVDTMAALLLQSDVPPLVGREAAAPPPAPMEAGTPAKAAALPATAATTPQSEAALHAQLDARIRSLATPMTAPSKSTQFVTQRLHGFGSGLTPATQPRPAGYQVQATLPRADSPRGVAAPTPKREDDHGTMRSLFASMEDEEHDSPGTGGDASLPPLMQLPRSAAASAANTPTDSPTGKVAAPAAGEQAPQPSAASVVQSVMQSVMQLDVEHRNAILRSIQDASGDTAAAAAPAAEAAAEDMPTLLPLAP